MGLATPSQAAVWAWGCTGSAGGKQIAFNRQKLLLATTRKPLGRLDAIVQGGDFSAAKEVGPADAYLPQDDNGGLAPKMTYVHESDKARTIVLTEMSSRRTGHSDTVVHGCRSEIIERFTKTYRVEMPGQPAQTASFACMDYQLTTRSGRTCR